MWYRLIYSDGSFGAWTKNYEWIKECADFFHAIIEEKKEEEF